MKKLLLVFVSAVIAMSTGCSKSDSNTVADSTTAEESFDEQSVIDMLNALNANNIEAVKALLEENPNLVKATFTAGGPQSGWPFVMITANNGNLELTKLLIENGANVNAQNFSEETALMYAARKGHKEIVELLIDNGADVNASSAIGTTALKSAESYPEIKQVLTNHGAK